MRSTFKATFLLLALSMVVSAVGLGCNNDAADTKPAPTPDNAKVKDSSSTGTPQTATPPKGHD